ncbi:hypothetical protein NQ318_006528, partial [Aromia moschata]
EMVYLTEMHKIKILQMIGYGDRTRTQDEVVCLFQEKYLELPPISQGADTVWPQITGTPQGEVLYCRSYAFRLFVSRLPVRKRRGILAAGKPHARTESAAEIGENLSVSSPGARSFMQVYWWMRSAKHRHLASFQLERLKTCLSILRDVFFLWQIVSMPRNASSKWRIA